MAKGALITSVSNPSSKAVWVAIELFEDVSLHKHRQNVEKEIEKQLKGCEIFIPVHDESINGKRYFTVLHEGYVYVKYPGTKEFDKKFSGLHGTYITGPLLSGRRSFAFFTNAYIESLRSRAKDTFTEYTPQKGDVVSVQHEILSGMEGIVHEVDLVNKTATVHIKMRSQEVVSVVKFTNIQAKTDNWQDFLQ